MKLIYSLALTASLLASATSCRDNSPVEVGADSPYIHYMGRLDRTNPAEPAFSFPGTTAMLSFEADSVAMHVSPGSGYFVVEIDSLAPQKVCFGPTDSVMTLGRDLGEGLHNLRVTYCIEGYEKSPRWRGFTLSPGAKLHEPAVPEGPKIEFIGNSITCGYGTDAEGPEIHFSYDTENHCLSYAHQTARLLDADYYVVARSGSGIYRNYNGPREGSPDGTIPSEYDNTLIYCPDVKWDFSTWQPDVVCINLGTNDTSLGNYDIALFGERYGEFLSHLRSVYPDAKFVLLTGSMLHGKALDDVRHTLDSLAASRPGVMRFDMSEETGELGYGADYHPSPRRAALNAVELSQFIANEVLPSN